MYITTAGVGAVEHGLAVGPASVRPGDAVILSGDLGRHGIAVMAVREGFQFDTDIASDCAPLWGPVSALLGSGVQVRCLRDLTRGGLASALVEIADGAKVEIMIEEDAAPVSEPVRVACEILGYDPLHVANEGRFVAFVPYPDAERALAAMRSHPVASEAVIIGRVSSAERGEVVMRTMGGLRPVDMLSGEQLPRIC
jgi:hydrogenase expression/formation protein HypE